MAHSLLELLAEAALPRLVHILHEVLDLSVVYLNAHREVLGLRCFELIDLLLKLVVFNHACTDDVGPEDTQDAETDQLGDLVVLLPLLLVRFAAERLNKDC